MIKCVHARLPRVRKTKLSECQVQVILKNVRNFDHLTHVKEFCNDNLSFLKMMCLLASLCSGYIPTITFQNASWSIRLWYLMCITVHINCYIVNTFSANINCDTYFTLCSVTSLSEKISKFQPSMAVFHQISCSTAKETYKLTYSK